MWHEGWGWGAGAWVMVMLMVLFWGAIIATVVWAIRQYRPRDADRGDTATSAMRILEERFARGEMDQDEFEQRRRTLRGQ